MKVFLTGNDGVGWSIDNDRKHVWNTMQGIMPITTNFFVADVIWSVWYTNLLKPKYRFFLRLFKKRVVATVTNDIFLYEEVFFKLSALVDLWICANTKQRAFLLEHGIANSRVFLSPYYVDETCFMRLAFAKPELCEVLKIGQSPALSKRLIGSFQRDTVGKDLISPKWHKGPELLVEIMSLLPTHRYALLLAGPRRHYVVNACRSFGVDFLFVGDSSFIDQQKDDILDNNLEQGVINKLYNLADYYLVTSRSEGGPKAISEASLCELPILSTDVGMAKDLLDEFAICVQAKEFVDKICRMEEDEKLRERLVRRNYERVSAINNRKAFALRIEEVKTALEKLG